MTETTTTPDRTVLTGKILSQGRFHGDHRRADRQNRHRRLAAHAAGQGIPALRAAEETNRFPRCWQKNPWIPCPYCSRGCRNVSITRSMQRTSSLT